MPTYKYESVIAALQDRIRDGTYPPGSKLPTRRELRAQYEVSDIVITFAMRALRQQGLVESLPGVGVYVAEPPAS
jgi:DNA-binding GntR family transcriptional regulator